MFCKSCGEELRENIKFCSKCGASTTPTNTKAVAPISISKATGVLPKINKGSNKKLIFNVSVVAGILIIILAGIMIVNALRVYPENTLAYIKNDEVYIKLGNNKTYNIHIQADDTLDNRSLLLDYIELSKDRKNIYGKMFFANDSDGFDSSFDFYRQNISKINKKNEKLASDIDSGKNQSPSYYDTKNLEKTLKSLSELSDDQQVRGFSSNGGVFYQDGTSLYYEDVSNKNETTKIASNLTNYTIGNFKYVNDKLIYFVSENTLYKTDLEGNKEKIANKVIDVSVLKNGDVYYRIYDNKLSKSALYFYKLKDGSKNKIDSDVSDFYEVEDGKYVFYSVGNIDDQTNASLHVLVDGKTEVLLGKNLGYISRKPDMIGNKDFIIQTAPNTIEVSGSSNILYQFTLTGKDTFDKKVIGENIRTHKVSGKNIYYTQLEYNEDKPGNEDMKLLIYKDGKLIVIEDKIMNWSISETSGYAFYSTSNKLEDAKDLPQEGDSDYISKSNYDDDFSEDDTITISSYDGVNKTTINDNVMRNFTFCQYDEKTNTVYYLNSDNILYMKKNNSKPEKIDNNVDFYKLVKTEDN